MALAALGTLASGLTARAALADSQLRPMRMPNTGCGPGVDPRVALCLPQDGPRRPAPGWPHHHTDWPHPPRGPWNGNPGPMPPQLPRRRGERLD
jgi:hypothetical protein